MLKRLLPCFLIFWLVVCEGQKSDYVWLQGYSYGPIGYDTGWGFYFGTTLMNFNNNPRTVVFDSTYKMNFTETNTSFCDSDGNLLFYTNGVSIDNQLDQTVENGDSLNAGWFQYVWDPSIQYYGYRNPQGVVVIPNPANTNQYYLLYSFEDSLGPDANNIYTKRLYCALLDMSDKNGMGKVLFKDSTLIEGILESSVVATRHANGRDWWIIIQQKNTNCYYRVLIDISGVHLLPEQNCLGQQIIWYTEGDAATFSPDGGRYIYLENHSGLSIFDFDRCSGTLSNSRYLPLPIIADSGWLGMGVAVSPNSQYLYLSLTAQFYQFNLKATDILGSIDTIGIFDGTNAPFGAYFNTAQLGPDGKIYISCGNADTVYHVVNNPDEQGVACNFQQHSLQLPSPSGGVPNFPNYRLGALIGSACDTLTGLSELAREEKEGILKVFPNPATDIVTVDYGFTNWSAPGTVSLVIVNELGEPVYNQPVPQYSGYQRINVSRYASGVYTAYVKRNGMVVAEQKFAKE